MCANRPVRLISGDGSEVDRIQYRQPGFGSTHFGNGRGVSRSRAERRRYPDELLVEPDDGNPLGAAAVRPLSVYRLNGGFELKSTGTAMPGCFSQVMFRLF